MAFTGQRAEHNEYLKFLINEKLVSRSAYKAELATLNALQEKENARIAKARETRAANKLAIIGMATQNAVLDLTVSTDEDEPVEPFVDACDKLLGTGMAYLQVTRDGRTVISQMVSLRGGTGRAIYYNSIRPLLIVYIDGMIVSVFDKEYMGKRANSVRIVLVRHTDLPLKKLQQIFRDSTGFCVIEPLINKWKQMAANSESDGSKKRLLQIARKLEGLKTVYPEGVPENDMEAIGKIVKRALVLHDIIGNVVCRYNTSSTQEFHFTNTRVNHVEPGRITLGKDFEIVTKEQLKEIQRGHEAEDCFYHFVGKVKENEPQAILSCKGAWAVQNPQHDLFMEFSESIGIRSYGINAIKYPELNQFLLEGRIINSTPTPLCDEPNNMEGATHIDMDKAYTQHKKAKYWRGFLGHITQYRKLNVGIEFLETHNGIFEFVVTKPIAHPLLGKFQWGQKYILPGFEIEYYCKDYGLGVTITAGAWGSTFDFDYTEEMLENRNYCIWAGKLGQDNDHETYTFKGGDEWAAHLKSILGDERVYFFKEAQMIVVKNPKKFYYTTHHILAFITAATRVNVLEMLRSIKGEPIKIIMDGIYFRGELPVVNVPYKVKEHVVHKGFRDSWYYPTSVSTRDWTAYDERFDGNCILSGAGGTGKTHSVLTDKGLVDVKYVVPSHLLGKACANKYGVQYITIHKLLGNSEGTYKCRPYKEDHPEPGFLLIDELTMIEGSWIEKALKMYPDTMFLIAGDIDKEGRWYQCRNGHPGNFSKIWIPKDWRYVEYKTDFRSNCPELQALKLAIRSEMRRVFKDGEQFDAEKICGFIRKNYPVMKMDDACKMFVAGDYWIAGTHKINDRLLKAGVVSGYINNEKEIVQEEGGEKRGSFTTHSFQGLTIPDARVFISLDAFEYAMIYTAVSRVTKMSQLVFVETWWKR